MSLKVLQFSPKAGTRGIRMKAIPETLTGAYSSGDIGFLRSWLEDDSDSGMTVSRSINWGAISGLALSLIVSAGFWTGVALIIERLLK